MKFNKKTAKRMGSKGGNTTKKNFGLNHFKEIARVRWDKNKKNEVQVA